VFSRAAVAMTAGADFVVERTINLWTMLVTDSRQKWFVQTHLILLSAKNGGEVVGHLCRCSREAECWLACGGYNLADCGGRWECWGRSLCGRNVAAPMIEATFEKQLSAQAVWKSYALAYLFPRPK
jgi:hypothetical protein